MSHPERYFRLQNGQRGWPEAYESDGEAQAYLVCRVTEILGKFGPLPLREVVDHLFVRESTENAARPGSLWRVVSVDMQYALADRALRRVGAESRWHLPDVSE